MKYITKLLTSSTLALLISIILIFSILVICVIVEYITGIDYKDIIHHIGNFSIGVLCYQVAHCIINKVGYNEIN